MASTQALANTILLRSFNEKLYCSPMKLQKLMYFICRDWAKNHSSPLVIENFQAWKYGPVLPSIYEEFKGYGSSSIRTFAKNSKDEVFIIDERENNDIKCCIDQVWDNCKTLSGIKLSELTHKEGGAWETKYKDNQFGIEITFEDLKRDRIKY